MHVSASFGSFVIPLRGLTAAFCQCVSKLPRCQNLHVIPASVPESAICQQPTAAERERYHIV